MKRTHTTLAVALAIIVVAIIFVFPQFSPFPSPFNKGSTAVTEATSTSATSTGLTTSTTTTTMSTDNLQTTDTTVGTGATAEPGDVVVVEYTGKLDNGTVFDTSVGKPAIAISPCPAGTQTGLCFTLGGSQVIRGWDEGVVGMKVGGERTLVIPPSLGYGSAGAGNVIPPNATLTFDVKLLAVQKGSGN